MPSSRAHLRIVAVNDVYSLENLPRLKTLIDEQRRGCDRLLVTLAGDFLAPSLLSSLDNGRGMVACLRRLGVTHVTFGNHEDDIPGAELRARIRELGAVWLATNVHGFDPPLPESDVIELGDPLVRVGLIGVAIIEPVVYRHPPFAPATLEEPNVAALREAKRLLDEDGCAYVIALTHQSNASDEELCRAQRGSIPLLLGGHEHVALDETIDGARLIKAGMDAENAIVVDLVWEGASASPTLTARLEPVRAHAEDAELRALVDLRMRPARELVDATLLTLAPHETLSSIGARSQETSLGRMLCSRVRDVLGAEACTFNGGSVRGSREYAARFTYGDLEAEVPFDNEIVVVAMPGAVLAEAIASSRAKAPADSGGFLQVDDALIVDRHGAIVSIAGAPIDATKSYRVALPRDLLLGLDQVEPLVRFGRENPSAIPPHESGRSPKELLVRSFAIGLWEQLGGFDAIDENHDGVVTKAEVEDALTRATHEKASAIVAGLIIDTLDTDHDHAVSRAELERGRRRDR